jgi:hypothetical protein
MLHLAAMFRRLPIVNSLPILFLLISGACLAQSPAVTGFSGGTVFVTVDGTNMTVGYTFTANTNLSVSAIGFWESNTSVPLGEAHQVGLWTSTGTLLASGTVQVNSPVTGNWRYASITPVTLTAGQQYVVGSDVVSPFPDAYERIPSSGGSVSTSLITILNSDISPSASGFAFPNTAEGSFLARFGPNMLVTQVITTVPVTPWALAAIAVALLAAGLLLLRKNSPAPATSL